MSGSTTSNPKTIRRRAAADTPPIASEERALAFGAPTLANARTERAPHTRHGERTPPTPEPTPTEMALELADEVVAGTAAWTRGAPPPSFFEDWPDAVLRFDRTLAVVYANPALERATALSRVTFIGHRLDQVEGFEEFAPLWLAKLAELFATEEACLFKFAFAHPTGRKLFDVRLAPERANGEAETLYATAVLRDVTVPRHALRASREADELVDTVLASAKIGIAIIDRDLRYRVWNEYLEELLEVPAAEVIGRTPQEAFGFSADSGAWRALLRMRDGEVRTTQQEEYAFPRHPRSKPAPWVRVRRTPMFDARGAFSGAFLTLERIDRERFAETSLAALRKALDSAGEMVLEIHRNGTIVDANETALAWLGYPREALKGMTLTAIDVTLAPEKFSEILEQLTGRGAYQGEARYRTRLGSEFSVDVVLQRVEHGEREFIFLLVRDISDRKRVEAALADSAARFRTIFEESPVANFLLDSRFRIMQVNRAATALLGYSAQLLVGQDMTLFLHPEDAATSQRLRERLAAGHLAATESDRRLRHCDGHTLWAKLSVRAWLEASGERHFLLVLEDFTERKTSEEALQVALRDQQTLLETMSVGVAQALNGQILLANREFAQMFGYADGEVIGMSLWDLTHDRAEHMLQAMSGLPAVRANETTAAEVVLFRHDGSPVWCLVQARAVEGSLPADGRVGQRPGEAIYTFQDISDSKRQQDQMQTLLNESQLIFDTALVGLLFVRDGRPVRANRAMEELLASEPGGLTSQIQLFAHPTDQLLIASLAEHFEEINERGTCEFEIYMYRRKGDPIWVAVQGRAVDPERPGVGYIFAFVDIDDRKRQEAQLRTTLAELQLIFDNALVGMVYVADDLVVKANAATERLFGYDAADLRELLISSLFAQPNDWQQVLAQAAGDGSTTFERLFKRADNTTFWCAGNVRPLDPANPQQGLILALMDVDLRRRSEDELRRVRNYLDLVVENLPVLVSVRDAETGRFTSLNRAGEFITGLKREQVIGRTWHEVYGRHFADLYAELDRKALAGGTQVDRPRDVMLRADGRTLTVNQRIVPLFEPESVGPDLHPDGHGRARYVMSIVDDLTEEVRAEAQLAETETRFRQFAENIDQLVFIATADLGTIFYVNPRYSTVVGADPEELAENPRAALAHVHFDDVPMVHRMLPRLVARMRRVRKTELNVRIDHPSRGVRLLNVRLSPVRLRDGTVRVFGIADDITERSAAEKQRIEEAVKQRDILVREVHHRIKNNLQGVAGLLQHMSVAKPELSTQLNEIAGQIQAIAQVHGLQIRATGTLPVLGVVQGIFTNLSNMFGVEIRAEPPPPALWRWGLPENEAVPLALVINELGTNAIKYRGGRDQGISVRVMPRAEGLELRIENPGVLASGFDLARIASGVSGLGLVKALLPRRGARMAIEQLSSSVVTRLELTPPAIGEDVGS